MSHPLVSTPSAHSEFLLPAPVHGEGIADYVARVLDLKSEIATGYLAVAFDNATLCDRKQLDYGPRNISGFGVFGVLVRMNDKFERLKTLHADGQKRRKPKNESIRDTYRDIANYAVISLMLQGGLWPK